MADDGVTEISPEARNLPIRSGAFVAVVGRSGSGKDTLIGYARRLLAGETAAVFVRRVVTRSSNADFEDHDTATDESFDAALAAGAFALTWRAHGLKYGLPASVDSVLQEGRVAIANVSRGAISAARRRYAAVVVVEITAATELLEARLADRGRESGGAVQARLAREVHAADVLGDARRIDNSGAVSIGGEALVAIIGETIASCRAGRIRLFGKNAEGAERV